MEDQVALVSSSTLLAPASSAGTTSRDPRTPSGLKSPNPRSALARANHIKGSSSFPSEPRSMGLLVKPIFTNTLPDLPMDPKFVVSPLRPSRFVDFKSSSLDILQQHEVHFDPNMNVNVDLVIPPDRNPVYMPAVNSLGQEQDEHDGEGLDVHIEFDEKDAKLMEDGNAVAKVSKFPLKRSNASLNMNGQRSESHRKSVAWLRRTEYISTEQTRFQPQFLAQERIEAKIGVALQRERKQLLCNYDDRESRIKAIEKTFEDVKKPITQHFAKPGVVPVEVMDVFPDFDLWKYGFAMVSFDSDPSLPTKEVRDELAAGAMIRGVTDETGDQFVAYFLPNDETFLKLREDKVSGRIIENHKYEYEMAREYNWSVKPQGNGIENLFFVIRDNAVYYNEIETRITLSKRRTPGTPYHQQMKSKLTVTNVPKSAVDYATERARERFLEPKPDYDAVSDDEEADNKSVHSLTITREVDATRDSVTAAGASNPQTPVDGGKADIDGARIDEELMVNTLKVKEDEEPTAGSNAELAMHDVDNNVVPDSTNNVATCDFDSVEN